MENKFHTNDIIKCLFAVKNRLTIDKNYKIVFADNEIFYIADDSNSNRYFKNEGNNDFWVLSNEKLFNL
jgi:hypothetical protein